MKGVEVKSVVALVGVRVVNAWFYATPLDTFVARTVLMIALAYAIREFRARYRRA
jgi:hypothetical protein